MNTDLQHRERRRLRSVDQRPTRRTPSAAVSTGALARKVSEGASANSPDRRQTARPWSIRWRRSSTSLAPSVVSSNSSGASPSSACVGRRSQRDAFSCEPKVSSVGGKDPDHPDQPVGLLRRQPTDLAPVAQGFARQHNPVEFRQCQPAGPQEFLDAGNGKALPGGFDHPAAGLPANSGDIIGS